METLNYIVKKYNIDLTQRLPYFIDVDRWSSLPQLFKELGFKVGAEIGVLQGDYTKVLCEAGFKIYGIDAWQFYHTYKDFRRQKHLDAYEIKAREKLKSYDCILLKGWSMDIVKQFADESLDFIFIDGNHDFRHVTEDIDEWSKKVRKGGIISGHDYIRTRGSNCMHVKDVVPAYAHAYKISPWFVMTGNKCKGWFWVK